MSTTTSSKTAAVTVTVINRGHGTIEVHRPTCHDLTRDAAGASVWNVEVTDGMKDVVLDIYPPSDFDYSADADDWTHYATDVVVMPCCPSLDGRKTKRNAEWARQYRARTANRYPVLVTME